MTETSKGVLPRPESCRTVRDSVGHALNSFRSGLPNGFFAQ
ncbi:hypothetical protein [Pseudoflavonifractor phocaeensis]|nr:hypothetical protein [Pseudoflavonifractor phocaeensis]